MCEKLKKKYFSATEKKRKKERKRGNYPILDGKLFAKALTKQDQILWLICCVPVLARVAG